MSNNVFLIISCSAMDTFSKGKRRQIMQAVRRSRTRPELRLAELLSQLGVEFEQNVASLSGRPDFYFPTMNLVAFVHGCFWHGHTRCAKGCNLPKTNRAYWAEKIARNKRRDNRIVRQLRQCGFRVFTVWECELVGQRQPRRLLARLTDQG